MKKLLIAATAVLISFAATAQTSVSATQAKAVEDVKRQMEARQAQENARQEGARQEAARQEAARQQAARVNGNNSPAAAPTTVYQEKKVYSKDVYKDQKDYRKDEDRDRKEYRKDEDRDRKEYRKDEDGMDRGVGTRGRGKGHAYGHYKNK